MFYAYHSRNEVPEFAAFETKEDAVNWVVSEVDKPERVYVDEHGDLACDSRYLYDFGFEVYSSLEAAIKAQASLDPEITIFVIRKLLDVAEEAETEY